MAAGDSSDIFMMFEYDGGKLSGETQTELLTDNPSSRLLLDFEAGKIFEITKFNLGVGIDQPDPDNTAALQKVVAKLDPTYKPKRPPPAKAQPADPAAPQKQGSTVSMQPITFVRYMDKASHALLYHVIKRTYFKQVSLVKRKSAGSAAAGEPYLRLDFNGVVLIDSSWSNEDPIEETYKFHARAISMRYCPQLPDGSLGAPRAGLLEHGARREAKDITMLSWASWAVTDVGTVRNSNQDSFVNRPDARLWAVADGAGGHQHGERASAALRETLEATTDLEGADLVGAIRTRVAIVHAALCREADAQTHATGQPVTIASTLVVLLAQGEHFACLWCGDSRAYLLRRGTLTQITPRP